MTADGKEQMVSRNCADTQSEGCNYGENIFLKKGPWTSAEDAILVDYVAKHGEGNWNAVQKHSGLPRCGKSCRLRWANHLRPDLKKGAFTLEEEHLIIELHAKMGNRWARMAAELPGRTDNEIKNFWNTRIKRRQRAGLSAYPPNMCLQALIKIQENGGSSACSPVDEHRADISNISVPKFKSLELNQQLCSQQLFDIHHNSSSLQFPFSSHSSSPTNSLPSKCLRESDFIVHGLDLCVGNDILNGNRHPCDDSAQNSHSFTFPFAYEFDPASDRASNHAELNCDPYSEPAWATKLELPSLQTPMGTWGSPASPLPSLESVDTLIQTPPTECTNSSNLYPINSGLLDAVLYESEARNVSGHSYYKPTSLASFIENDVKDTEYQDLPMTDWGVFEEPVPPFVHSSFVFSDCTRISQGSLDEPKPGYKVEESANLAMTRCTNEAEIQTK